jgi:hypothetical protein
MYEYMGNLQLMVARFRFRSTQIYLRYASENFWRTANRNWQKFNASLSKIFEFNSSILPLFKNCKCS